MSADYAMHHPLPRPPLRLGEILVQAGILTEHQLETVLGIQASMPHDTPGRRLGAIIVSQGLASEMQITLAVARRLDIPIVDLDAMSIPIELLRRIPKSWAMRCGAVAYGVTGDRLHVALVDPTNTAMVEDLRIYVGVGAIDVALAPWAQIAATLHRVWVEEAADEPPAAAPEPPSASVLQLATVRPDHFSLTVCRACQRTLNDDMIACPWCATPVEHDGCLRCFRRLAPDWLICPWCMAPRPESAELPA